MINNYFRKKLNFFWEACIEVIVVCGCVVIIYFLSPKLASVIEAVYQI